MDKTKLLLSIIDKNSKNMEKISRRIKSKYFYKLKDLYCDEKLSELKHKIMQMLLNKTLKYLRRKDIKHNLKLWHHKSNQIILKKSKENKIKLISKIIKSIFKWNQQRLVKSHFSLWNKFSNPKTSGLNSIYKNFIIGFLILKKTITNNPLNSFFRKMNNQFPNNSSKIILKTTFIRFFSLELNLYAVEFNHMQRLCKFLKTIVKFKEMNKRTFLITILKNWWLAASMKKFKTNKIAGLYQKKNLLFLEACEDLFGDRPDSVQEYVQKVYNLNSKQQVYSEKFQLDSKEIVQYGYEEETREVQYIKSNDSPVKYGKIRNISGIKSKYFEKNKSIQKYQGNYEDSEKHILGDEGKNNFSDKFRL